MSVPPAGRGRARPAAMERPLAAIAPAPATPTHVFTKVRRSMISHQVLVLQLPLLHDHDVGKEELAIEREDGPQGEERVRERERLDLLHFDGISLELHDRARD